MPKRKANWWPSSILSDPDVLSMDDEGRFVLCKICHVHYAVHGGKKPKPVIMNSNFRTRAWDVHKERTNSHRLQKRQQQQEQQQQQQEQKQQLKKAPTTQEQVVQTAATTAQSLHDNVLEPVQQRQQQVPVQPNSPVQIQSQTRTPSLAGAVHTAQNRAQTPVPTEGLIRSHSGTQVSQQRRQRQQQLQQLQRLQDSDDTDDAGHDRLQAAARECAAEKPVSPRLQATPAVNAVSVCSSGPLPSNKRSAAAMPLGAPISRRRAFRAGSPRSPRHVIADLAVHRHEKHSFMVPGSVSRAKGSPAPSEHAIAMEQQADSSARWRHMHDDVSRALSPSPRRRQQGPASYTSGELRAAKTLVQTETGDLGGNNSERVAKKLRSLNAEYHASNMRYADAYNMRHTFDILDRSSAGYKEYWGTLRDVYTSSGVSGAGAGSGMSYRKSYHRGNPSAKSTQECTEAEAETTTPEDSGSSEDAFKPAVVVHDTSLINAIEKLTDAASKQIANLYEQKATGTREALTGLTLVMTDLRVQCGQAFERMIELQEKNLKVMGSILDVKLRKEAARNARTGCSDNELSSAGSTGTGCESIGLT